MALNSLLLFIVLLYVYPLKLLSEIAVESLLGTALAVTASMGLAEIRGLYLIFGAAVVAGFALLTAMHLRAWQLRDELALDELDSYELRQEVVVYAAHGLVSVLSLLTAALGLGLSWGLPVWLLILLSPPSSSRSGCSPAAGVGSCGRRLKGDSNQCVSAPRKCC